MSRRGRGTRSRKKKDATPVTTFQNRVERAKCAKRAAKKKNLFVVCSSSIIIFLKTGNVVWCAHNVHVPSLSICSTAILLPERAAARYFLKICYFTPCLLAL